MERSGIEAIAMTANLSMLGAIKKLRNFHYYLLDSNGWIKNDYMLTLRNGVTFHIRPKKGKEVADIDIVREVIVQDEYHLDQISHDDVIVDIGAQIGTFALLAAKRARSVYAFEPVPHNYAQLRKNVEANGFDNIKIFERAVTATGGPTTIFLSAENEGAHSMYAEDGKAYVRVSSVSLKSLVEQIGRINLLKMDCEGAEYPVILHSPRECFEQIDRIIMELHYTPAIEKNFSKGAVIECLTRHGFSILVHREIHYETEGSFSIVRATRDRANGSLS